MPDNKLTPDEMLEIARGVATKEDVEGMMRAAINAAKDDECPPPTRQFVASILLPKDMSKVDDKRFKVMVVCTFEQYNNVKRLELRIAELEKKLRDANIPTD